MQYKWSNENKLDTLKASGDGEILVFETSNEYAEVYLKNRNIEKVVFRGTNISPSVIDLSKAHVIVVGKGNTERDVYHYLKPGGPSPTMRLGITVHRGEGTWSSLPHDFELNTEPGFEEIFFYIFEGASKLGVQVGRGVWFDNKKVDTVWQIKDHTFGTVPMGYHPVVGEPGVKVSYIWVYLAKKKSWEKIK